MSRKTVAQGSDEALIPHEVVNLVVQHNCNLIGAWRRYRGLTQTQLADAMRVTQAAVSQLERGDNPHADTLVKAAQALGIDADQLID